ncbi:acetylcholine receptor subunit epsilon-like [Plodia interpunctella]|uniref:acetylcholine receptor subunit epsilon-like n=1 Tax=Plodia interpunctella TaxID=58824 RepID=UPI0023682554|nr:acetylcholine receptor subunit epsilon-like [Plodia interpunctella]
MNSYCQNNYRLFAVSNLSKQFWGVLILGYKISNCVRTFSKRIATMFTSALLIMCTIPFIKNQDLKSNNQTLENIQEKRLMAYLNTQPITPPNDIINIDAYLFIQFFTFGHDESTIKVFGYLLVSWYDERLSWNTSDYGGLSEIVYESYTFWEPHISLLNQVDYDEFEYHYGLCRLYSSGLTSCLPKIVHESTCNTWVSNWPYDVQNCTIAIGLFAGVSTVNITERDDRVTFLIGGENSAFWKVLKVNYKYSKIDKKFDKYHKGSQIDITLLLKRKGAGVGVAVVFPMIALTILSLNSFVLSARNLRLGMLSFTLLCHFVFTSGISYLIPKYSLDCPTILFYLRGSILINMFLVMLTIFLSFLRDIARPMPTWLSDTIEFILESKLRFFILCLKRRDKMLTTKDMVIMSEWANCSDVINSLCLWLMTLVYVCFMCLYLPRESHVEADELDTFRY